MTKSSSASGAGHVLASRYATSLIDVAESAGALAAIEQDMVSLQSALAQSAELQLLVGNPVYSKDRQSAAVQEIGRKAGYHQLSINFLGVLAMNGRLGALGSVLAAFFQEMQNRHGVVEAKVVSAFPLTAAQQSALTQTLSSKTGKSVRLALDVDASLLGGMIVTVGSTMIDDSLKTRLEQLKHSMLGKKAA